MYVQYVDHMHDIYIWIYYVQYIYMQYTWFVYTYTTVCMNQ